MALIKCPECGREISDRAVSCPNCGFPLSESATVAEREKTGFEEKKVFCPFCGAMNLSTNECCTRCQTRLFSIDKEKLEPVVMPNIRVDTEEVKPRRSIFAISCPHCKSTNIQFEVVEYDKKKRTTISLNPLKPFTLFNHKCKHKSYEKFFCRDCGYHWKK